MKEGRQYLLGVATRCALRKGYDLTSLGICCLALILIFKTPMTEILFESEHFSCLVD